MVTGIYVSALAPESGKSLICLGLADTLHRHADRVGFFRPIVEGLGADHDPMILMLRHMYGLDPSVCLGGITLSAALGLLGAGRCDEIFGDAVVKYGQIAKQCDVVIVEGSGLRGHDDAAEFDLNARLANNLGLAVLAVVGAKGLSPEETADAVDVARKELASMRCSLLSVMVNRRRRRGRRHPCRLATRCPQASGLRHSGDPRDFAAHGGWRLGRASFGPVAGSTELDRDVGQVIVAAMNVGNFLSGLGTGDLVIVPGDRADVMVACLASALSPQFPTPSAMIMTKGLAANARAREIMLEGAYFGTMMVQLGEADGMVSGASHTTANTIRPALEFVKTRDGVRTVSSVFFMLFPDRVLVYGDCAVIPEPTESQLADIAIASADTAAQFGVEPRVAMLSYSTGGSGAGGAVDKVRRATALVKAARLDLPVEGPIQYDAAVDAAIANFKLPASTEAGQATVFIFPDLNTGNNTYKAVEQSSGAVAVGPILQGLRKPSPEVQRWKTSSTRLPSQRYSRKRRTPALRQSPPLSRKACSDGDRAVVVDRPRRVVGNLPTETIRVREVARVAAPGLRLRGSDDDGARGLGFGHRPVHVLGTGDVVAQRDARNARRRIDGSFTLHLFHIPEGQHQAVVDLEEEDVARKLGLDRPAKAVDIETARRIDVAHAQRDEIDARFHRTVSIRS